MTRCRQKHKRDNTESTFYVDSNGNQCDQMTTPFDYWIETVKFERSMSHPYCLTSYNAIPFYLNVS